MSEEEITMKLQKLGYHQNPKYVGQTLITYQKSKDDGTVIGFEFESGRGMYYKRFDKVEIHTGEKIDKIADKLITEFRNIANINLKVDPFILNDNFSKTFIPNDDGENVAAIWIDIIEGKVKVRYDMVTNK